MVVFLIGLGAFLLGYRCWKKRREHGDKPDTLRWAFARYMTGCVLAAAALCGVFTFLFAWTRDSLEDRYHDAYYDANNYQQSYIVTANGILVGSTYIGFGGSDAPEITDLMTPGEARLYSLVNNSLVIVTVYLFLCVSCVGVTSVLFYKRRLQQRLTLLDEAAGRIAEGDLDFTVSVPGNDELTRLGTSFETMRAALADTNRKLWRTLEEERRVQAAFAHDLRTPLTVLRGYDELLLKYGDHMEPEKLHATLQTMHDNLRRLEEYTARMGRMRKLEALELAPAAVELAELSQSLREEGAALCGGTVAFTLEGCEGTLTLDEALLREVFENLTSNAARHARSAVRVTMTVRDSVLTMAVQDDGNGFSDAALSHAADAFWRDETAPDAARSEHFGLGLYICQVLCQKHGGALTLENGPEGGALVTAKFHAAN